MSVGGNRSPGARGRCEAKGWSSAVANELEPESELDLLEPPREQLVDLEEGDSLVVVLSPQKELIGKRFFLRREGLSIGSAESNDIHLRDADVASIHTLLIRYRRGWYVMDTGTLLGTYRNNLLITSETPIGDGDHLQIGQTSFLLRARHPASDRGRNPSAPTPVDPAMILASIAVALGRVPGR